MAEADRAQVEALHDIESRQRLTQVPRSDNPLGRYLHAAYFTDLREVRQAGAAAQENGQDTTE